MTIPDRPVIGPGYDRRVEVEALTGRLATQFEDGDTDWRVASGEFRHAHASARLEPAFTAADLGHTVTWDPMPDQPGGGQWVCTGCCASAEWHHDGSTFGVAVTDACKAARP